MHAAEQLTQVHRDQVLHRQHPHARLVPVDPHEARDVVGHLHPGEQLGPAVRVPDRHRQVQGTPGDVRERVRRVHRERGEHREDVLPEVGAQSLPFGVAQVTPAQYADALLGQPGQDVVDEAGGVSGDQLGGPFGDQLQLRAQGQPVAAAHRQTGGEPPFQAGDAHHVELVEVAGEDREELGPLQQGALVLGEGEHPRVEVEPGQLPVEEAVLRQRGSGRCVVVPSPPVERSVERLPEGPGRAAPAAGPSVSVGGTPGSMTSSSPEEAAPGSSASVSARAAPARSARDGRKRPSVPRTRAPLRGSVAEGVTGCSRGCSPAHNHPKRVNAK